MSYNEMIIRADERRKVRDFYRKKAEQRKERKRRKIKGLFIGLIGVIIIIGSLILAFSGLGYDPVTNRNDCTYLFFTLAVGVMVIMGGAETAHS